MGEYVKKKADMKFQSQEALKTVQAVIDDADAALKDKSRRIDDSPIREAVAGAVGVGVISLSSFLSSKISAFYLTLLLFIGQLFAGMLLDYLVAGDFSLNKVIGGILVIAGLSYNLWIDTKRSKTSETSSNAAVIEA